MSKPDVSCTRREGIQLAQQGIKLNLSYLESFWTKKPFLYILLIEEISLDFVLTFAATITL